MPSARTGPVAAIVAAVALAVPALAAADDDEPRDDVRVAGTCSGSGEAELRVRRRDDDQLRVDLVLRAGRRGGWSVVVVHERRLAFRGRVVSRRSSGAVSLRQTLEDLFGADTVTVRATGPMRTTCRATATVAAG